MAAIDAVRAFVRSFAVRQQNVQGFFSQFTGPKMKKPKHECAYFLENWLETKIGFVALRSRTMQSVCHKLILSRIIVAAVRSNRVAVLAGRLQPALL
jgi:hypothetical protein